MLHGARMASAEDRQLAAEAIQAGRNTAVS